MSVNNFNPGCKNTELESILRTDGMFKNDVDLESTLRTDSIFKRRKDVRDEEEI